MAYMGAFMKIFEVLIGEKMERVFGEKRNGKLWLHWGGRTRCFEPEKKSTTNRKNKDAAGTGEILAPMPGKILKVNVKVGDKVKTKQVLVVMEAMKMEYSLNSDVTGVVQSVRCQAGDQVELGGVLVMVSAEGAPA
jgi:acetyl/propionyl-CoA carboxylase alpha subunit